MNIKIPFTEKILQINIVNSIDGEICRLGLEQSGITGRINAIKYYRSLTGLGLGECKEYVDGIFLKNGIELTKPNYDEYEQ